MMLARFGAAGLLTAPAVNMLSLAVTPQRAIINIPVMQAKQHK
jgi:hypothetical protein